MHCPQCGYRLEKASSVCTRCKADISKSACMRRILYAIILATISLALVAALVYIVLSWHDSQLSKASRMASWYDMPQSLTS